MQYYKTFCSLAFDISGSFETLIHAVMHSGTQAKCFLGPVYMYGGCEVGGGGHLSTRNIVEGETTRSVFRLLRSS